MRLIKHAHACVTLEKGDRHFVIDPGTFTPNVAELIANIDTILITHEHFDHFDEAAITGALDVRAVNPETPRADLRSFAQRYWSTADGENF